MSNERASKLLIGGALVTSASLATASPASGDHQSSLTNRDNNEHGYTMYDLTDKGALACSHGMAQIGDQTEIQSNDGGGDVRCYDYDNGAGTWFGLTNCDEFTLLLNRCDIYDVRFNTYYLYASNDTWKSIGCHEIGHTSSVGHRVASSDPNAPYSCMRSSAAASRTTYDSHDVTAINADA